MPATSHGAPGASAGFSYQFERALYWLAQSPAGARIGIETEDDVAARRADGLLLVEQDKHSVRYLAKPFADRSKDLWNTLAIWLEAVEANRISIDNTMFLMVTNKILPDCIAKRISAASSAKAIQACVSDLRKAGAKPPETISRIVTRVLRTESAATLSALIGKIELADGSQATAGAELRGKTIAYLQLPEWCLSGAESILDELSGWVQKSAMAAWQDGQAAWIERDHFVNQLHAIIAARKRQVTREKAENLIPVADDSVGREKGRPFVKQLHLVTDDDVYVDVCIREFIRCNIEKIRLSKEGNVTDDDWSAFEATLLARWEKIRARVLRMRAAESSEEEIGFEILTDTTEDHREKLAGTETEQVYLTSGTYHRLADLLRVGWHPRFETLMRDFREER